MPTNQSGPVRVCGLVYLLLGISFNAGAAPEDQRQTDDALQALLQVLDQEIAMPQALVINPLLIKMPKRYE